MECRTNMVTSAARMVCFDQDYLNLLQRQSPGHAWSSPGRMKRARSLSVISAKKLFRATDARGDFAGECLPGSLLCEQTIALADKVLDGSIDIEMETRCIVYWLRQLEKYLHGNNVSRSLQENTVTAEEVQNHMAVQSSIEKLVCRLAQLKTLCTDHHATLTSKSSLSCEDVGGKLRRLEKRLQQCWLKSLERQCILEDALDAKHLPKQSGHSDESDEIWSYQPVQKCRRLSLSDTVHRVSPSLPLELDNMCEEKGTMVGTAGEGLDSLKLALNLAGGKFELVPQDVGYASESSMHLSADDVSPSQPIAPPLVMLTRGALPAAVLSDTDLPKDFLKKPLDISSLPVLSASPQEFYYKVAPLNLDLRADILTRSARSSLSKLRAGSKLAFSDDEDDTRFVPTLQPKERQLDSSRFHDDRTPLLQVQPCTPDAALEVVKEPARAGGRREGCIRARTLPPEQRTSLLASKCTAIPRKTRRRRPWSLILQEKCNVLWPEMSASHVSSAVSESALVDVPPIRESRVPSHGQLLRRKLLTSGRPVRQVVADWSLSSSDEDNDSEASSSELLGSRHTLITVPNFRDRERSKLRPTKSHSTSALWLSRERDMEASFWDDYQDPPYSSEAYSEKSVDESVVQRITNFGDDYSSLFPASSSLTLDLASFPRDEKDFSDSDSDGSHSGELCLVLNESRKQLQIGQNAFLRFGQTNELRATCETNIAWLTTIKSHCALNMADDPAATKATPVPAMKLGEEERSGIEDLITQWQLLATQLTQRETCNAFLRSVSTQLREIKIELQLHSQQLGFTTAVPNNRVLIRSCEACANIKRQYESKVQILSKLCDAACNVMAQLSSHNAHCRVCVPTGVTMLNDASESLSRIKQAMEDGEKQVQETEEYLQLLMTARQKMFTLQSSFHFAQSLPDLVQCGTNNLPITRPHLANDATLLEDATGEKRRKRLRETQDVRKEWKSFQELLQRMRSMERFILMDQDLLTTSAQIEAFLMGLLTRETDLLSSESRSCESGISCSSCSDYQARVAVVQNGRSSSSCSSIIRPSIQKEMLLSTSRRARRVCLITAPLAGLLVFLCLLGAFLLQPQCCSFSSPKSLLRLTVDYPNGSPPM